jgi:VCBS repeat-containing protein
MVANPATNKGLQVSFNNTPQAVDDFFSAAFDGLTEDNLATQAPLLLDVMTNDAGGKAKTLYSIDDGIDSAGAGGDLLQSDAVGVAGHSLHGATIKLTADGKISYDASTLDADFVASLQHLNTGEFATDTFTYAIRLGNGTLSWATATVQIAGVTDAPVLTVTGPVTGNAVEDGAAVALDALANASDSDPTRNLAVVNIPAALPAGVTYDAQTHAFALDPSVLAYQYLAQDQPTTVTVSYSITDGLNVTPTSVSWTVTGANDAPSLEAAVSGDPQFGDDSLMLSATMAFSETDLADTHTVSYQAMGTGYIGTFAPTLATDPTATGHGSVALTYTLTLAEFLAAGGNVAARQDYLVTIDDHHGGTSSQLVSIPLAQILSGGGGDGGGGGGGGGPNTDPDIYIDPAAHDSASAFVFDDINHPACQHVIGRLSFSDAEVQQFHDVSAVGQTPGPLGTLGTLFASILRDTNGDLRGSGDPDGFLAASATGGVLKWDYQVAEQKIQWLGQDETYTDHFQLMLMDGQSGFDTQDVAVTIMGANDAPVLQGDGVPSLFFFGAFSDTGSTATPGIIQTQGFGFIDPDRYDQHAVSAVLDLAHSTVDVAATFTVELTKETHTFGEFDINGQIRWTYQFNATATPYLPGHEGQQRVQTWDITIDDGHGGTTIPFVVTFNSAPQIFAIPEPGNPNIEENGSTTTIHGPTNAWSVENNRSFIDADPGDHHTVSFQFNHALSNVAAPVGTFDAVWLNDTGPDGQGGLLHYRYSQSDVTLPGGQPIHEAFDVIVDDGRGGFATHTIDFLLS